MARETFRKIITTDENLLAINPKNKELINKFLRSFDTKSAKTSVVNYQSDYNIFFCWNVVYNDNKFFVDIKKSDLIDFFSFAVSDLQWGSARYRRMHSALSSLSKYIENILDDEYPDFKSLMPKVDKIPNTIVREKTVLSETQINNLLEHLKQTNKQWACLFALAISSGARISELFRFTTDLINEENTGFDGIFLKTKKPIRTKGRGRSGTRMYKYIIKDIFLPTYQEWMIERKKILKQNNLSDHRYLFITREGTPATAATARRWIAHWEKYLSNEEPSNKNKEKVSLYPHSLRHYLVSHLTRLGLSSDLIVSIMGWQSSDMYKIYNDVSDDEREWKDLDKLKEYLEQKE